MISSREICNWAFLFVFSGFTVAGEDIESEYDRGLPLFSCKFPYNDLHLFHRIRFNGYGI